MPLGTFIAMSAESTPGDIMGNRCRCSLNSIELQERWTVNRQGPHRGYCKITEERYIIERPPPWIGAVRDTSENKIIRSRYRIKMREYWITLDPEIRERAERMSKYVKDPVPNEGACDFLEKARRAKARRPARSGREMAR